MAMKDTMNSDGLGAYRYIEGMTPDAYEEIGKLLDNTMTASLARMTEGLRKTVQEIDKLTQEIYDSNTAIFADENQALLEESEELADKKKNNIKLTAEEEKRYTEISKEHSVEALAELSKARRDARAADVKLEQQQLTKQINDQKLAITKEQDFRKNADVMRSKHESKLIAEKLAREKKLTDDIAKYGIAADSKRAGLMAKANTAEAERLKQGEANSLMASALNMNSDLSLTERMNAIGKAFTNQKDGSIDVNQGIKSLLSTLDKDIEESAKTQGIINTAMQGSKSNLNGAGVGNYWAAMNVTTSAAVGASYGVVNYRDYMKNLVAQAKEGRIYNLEQRAYLETIKDRIAATFDANNGVLLRLVRVQQQDTTAARLGMESALTAFLNNMYETSEYMKSVATSVKSNLQESMALMTAKDAVAYEYQVQKWMGSMYSVGMSDSGVSSISSALGKLTSGDLSGISSGGTSNLLIMAANRANMSLTQILEKGVTDKEANTLLASVVDYLQELYGDFSDSLVLQQEISKVYGLTASDLKAITNLQGSTSNISNNYLSYDNALGQLNSMANSAILRTGIGAVTQNIIDNGLYGVASGIGSSVVGYTAYKMAAMIEDLAGGLKFNIPTVMGTGTNQTFNIADIMRIGSLLPGAVNLLGQLGGAVVGAFGGAATDSNAALWTLGITGGKTTLTRGKGNVGKTTSGATESQSGVVSNNNLSDLKNKSMQDSKDEANEQIESTEENEVTLETINENLSSIGTDIASMARLMVRMIDEGAPVTVQFAGGIPNGFGA